MITVLLREIEIPQCFSRRVQTSQVLDMLSFGAPGSKLRVPPPITKIISLSSSIAGLPGDPELVCPQTKRQLSEQDQSYSFFSGEHERSNYQGELYEASKVYKMLQSLSSYF